MSVFFSQRSTEPKTLKGSAKPLLASKKTIDFMFNEFTLRDHYDMTCIGSHVLAHLALCNSTGTWTIAWSSIIVAKGFASKERFEKHCCMWPTECLMCMLIVLLKDLLMYLLCCHCRALHHQHFLRCQSYGISEEDTSVRWMEASPVHLLTFY